MVLVDSDILIEVSRAKDPAIVASWLELSMSMDPLLCSVVTVAELWAGARPAEHDALNQLFNSLITVPVSAAIAKQAGAHLLQYSKSHGLELGDALIAASAQATAAKLWTRNRKHYPMKNISFF
jgi:predicted nucleic acid-binding protein